MKHGPLTLDVQEVVFPLAEVFTISRGSRTEAHVIGVTLSDGTHIGQGESVPYARYDESIESVSNLISSLRSALSEGFSREKLQSILPAGAARNAMDCALWDLEAKQSGKPVWEIAGLSRPGPVETALTLSLEDPDVMRQKAAKNAHRPLLKIKLGGAGDLQRLEAVRQGAPNTKIIVDANEGWTVDIYRDLVPDLKRLGVAMVEQPLPAADDAALQGLDRPVPVCADESCHDRASLPSLTGKYDLINIKLDKTGGLTEALALKSEAEANGFDIMIGCMVSSSLAMAPAVLLAQDAQIVDLDGPLLLGRDRPNPLVYDQAGVHPPTPQLWG